jgi:hypothetical protein
MPIKVKGIEIIDDNRNIKNADGSQVTGIVTSITAGTNISVNQSTGNVTISLANDVADTYWKKDAVGIAATYKVGIGTTASSDSSLTIANNISFGFNDTKIGRFAGNATPIPTSTANLRYNTFVGYLAGCNSGSVCFNTFIGAESGSNATGSCNTFIGRSSGCGTGSDTNNTFIGHFAGGCNDQCGSRNVSIGGESGLRWRGDRNVFIGKSSGNVNYTSGTFPNNIFIGNYSGCYGDGCCNVFIGRYSGCNHTGSSNVAIGHSAGKNTAGSHNVFIGNASAMTSGCSSAGCSVFFGCNNGSFNVFIGSETGVSAYCNNNVLVGYRAGTGCCTVTVGGELQYSNTPHVNSVFIGSDAGAKLTSSIDTVLVGYKSGCVSVGARKTFIGSYSGYNYAGSDSVIIGYKAGSFLQSGDPSYPGKNVIIGNCGVGATSTTFMFMCSSTLIGNDILTDSTCGASEIVAIGNSALYKRTGSPSMQCGVYIGDKVASTCTSVGRGVIIGNNAGGKGCGVIIGNCAATSGWADCSSVFIGECAAYSSEDFASVVLGYKASCNNDGSCNVIVGYNAGNSASCTSGTTGTNNIIIGANAGCNSTIGLIDISNKDNHIIIGNNDITNFYTKMRYAAFNYISVKWDPSTFELAADSSSRRFKTNIRPFLGGIKETLQLNPVVYNSIENPEGKDEIGFIAEEVNETDVKEFVIYDENQEPLAVSYDRMVALLTGAVKELYAKNSEIKERLVTLENTIQNHIENHA